MKYGKQFNANAQKHIKRKYVREYRMSIKNLTKQLNESSQSRLQALRYVGMLRGQLELERKYKWLVPYLIYKIKSWWARRKQHVKNQ